MIYFHDLFPNVEIYVEWNVNNHCKILLNDIIDLNRFNYIKFNFKYKGGEIYASTSNVNRTKWDNIKNWELHNVLVSVSFYIYSFISYKLTKEYFNTIPFRDEIFNLVNLKISSQGINRKLIHFRDGDLLNLLKDNEHNKDNSIKYKIIQSINDHKEAELYHFNNDIVDRSHNDVIDAIADLIYLSKYNIIIGYSPYSHFSSWIYLLSDSFIDDQANYPIFNYKKTFIIYTI
jgi:hypothetical protein